VHLESELKTQLKSFRRNYIQLVPKLGQLSFYFKNHQRQRKDKVLRLMTILKFYEVYIQVLQKGRHLKT